MRIEFDDWLALLVVLVVGGFALFGLVYWAVRMALTDHPAFPRFSCYVKTAGDSTEVTLSNVGPAPAYDVAVLWASRRAEPPLAQAAVLAPFGSLTWSLSRPQGDAAGAPPVDSMSVAYLVVRWSMAGASSRRVVSIPIRVPAGVVGAQSTVDGLS